MFACMHKISLKSLQEYSADKINRRHFQIQIFLAFLGLRLRGYTSRGTHSDLQVGCSLLKRAKGNTMFGGWMVGQGKFI